MEQAIQQLKSDSSDSMNHAGFALTYGAMAVCGVAIVVGLLAGRCWKWLARPRQSVRSIVRDPKRRASEASVVIRARGAGL